MKKALLWILCLSMILSLGTVAIAAEEATEAAEEATEAAEEATEAAEEATEAAEAETEAPLTLANNNIYDVWTENIVKSCFSNPNQTTIEVTDEGVKLSGVQSDTIDPFVTISFNTYQKFVNAETIKPSEYGYVVFKIKTAGTSGECELFYTSSPSAENSETNMCTADGEWEYVVFDLSYYDGWITQRRMTSVRLDWTTGYTDTAEEAYMIIGAIGFFKTEEEANAYAGIVPETKPPKTEAPETEAPAVTEAPATEAPAETEAPAKAGGCGGVIGMGAVAVLAAAAAVVALKKRED